MFRCLYVSGFRRAISISCCVFILSLHITIIAMKLTSYTVFSAHLPTVLVFGSRVISKSQSMEVDLAGEQWYARKSMPDLLS